MGRNSAFSHHHVPVDALDPDQVAVLLHEQHSQEDWIRLIRGVNQQLADDAKARGKQVPEVQSSVLNAIMPG
jgi:hypothetical protein